MFSMTTMASSTTNPVAMVMAMSDRLSMLNCRRYITPNVPIREMGTATLGMNVERELRRKRKTTRMTRAMEMRRVISTSRTEARIVRVASTSTDRSIVGGIAARSWGRTARTPSTVAMMLAPGWREMMTMIAGLPFERPAARMSSTESVTLAMSARRTAAPLR